VLKYIVDFIKWIGATIRIILSYILTLLMTVLVFYFGMWPVTFTMTLIIIILLLIS
jgi:hypothetical protein